MRELIAAFVQVEIFSSPNLQCDIVICFISDIALKITFNKKEELLICNFWIYVWDITNKGVFIFSISSKYIIENLMF